MSDDPLLPFWQAYLASLPDDYPSPAEPYFASYFGDSAGLAHELGELVAAGIKGGTTGLLKGYEADQEPLPVAGTREIVTEFDGNPLCVIEITDVEIKPFREVDAQFAYDEGEGDRSLVYWRDAHIRFFTRECARYGWEFNEEMLVVCARFRKVFPE
ncbi:MAG TPA: ASCH domain-containing protein [Anaerolineales bacterium]|nr:ASCH domain-containing protein [Anaerolineales bacterium]